MIAPVKAVGEEGGRPPCLSLLNLHPSFGSEMRFNASPAPPATVEQRRIAGMQLKKGQSPRAEKGQSAGRGKRDSHRAFGARRVTVPGGGEPLRSIVQ